MEGIYVPEKGEQVIIIWKDKGFCEDIQMVEGLGNGG